LSLLVNPTKGKNPEEGRRNLCWLHGMISEFGTEKGEIIKEINKLYVV
jgi:hypothetical protein